MNQFYAQILVVGLLLGLGSFHVMRGRATIRSRTEKSWGGWIRIVVGVLIALASLPLIYFFFLGSGAEG